MSSKFSSNMKPYHFMIPAVVLSAGVIITGKLAVAELGVYTILFLRFLFASITLLPIVIKNINFLNIGAKDILKLTMVGLIGFFTYNLLIIKALSLTSAVKVSIISSLIPAVTLFLEHISIKERIRFKSLGVVMLSAVAVLIAITNGNISTLGNLDWNYGDILMLLAVFCISFYSIMNAEVSKSYNSVQVLFFYFIVTLILSFPLFIKEIADYQWAAITYKGILAVIYHGVFGSTATYLLIQNSLKLFGASNTMIYMNLIPLVAFIASVVILGEPLTTSLIISAAIICMAIYLNIKETNKKTYNY